MFCSYRPEQWYGQVSYHLRVARTLFTIPMGLRLDSTVVGDYPHPDVSLRDWLINNAIEEPSFIRKRRTFAIFLAALFELIVPELLRNIDTGPRGWQSSLEDDFNGETRRQFLYDRVATLAQGRLEENEILPRGPCPAVSTSDVVAAIPIENDNACRRYLGPVWNALDLLNANVRTVFTVDSPLLLVIDHCQILQQTSGTMPAGSASPSSLECLSSVIAYILTTPCGFVWFELPGHSYPHIGLLALPRQPFCARCTMGLSAAGGDHTKCRSPVTIYQLWL
ncbi:hypothetical protein C8Q80DRAFT_135084 [Daedaleopsis nitida]|nr:hypothetical protein C8Q80DRAFT_135084 [Daedaleopsis nitida]